MMAWYYTVSALLVEEERKGNRIAEEAKRIVGAATVEQLTQARNEYLLNGESSRIDVAVWIDHLIAERAKR